MPREPRGRWREAAARLPLILLGIFASLSAVGAVAATQNVPDATETAPPELFAPAAQGAVVHRSSGFSFPARLGDMPRRKYRIFAANDVQVNYTHLGGGNNDPWLDVYVYPAPRSVRLEAAEVERSLAKTFSAVPTAVQPGLPPRARGAQGRWFDGNAEGRAFTTGYVLVKRGHWYLLARGSSPKAAGPDGMIRLQAAIAGIDWRWTGKPPHASDRSPTRVH